MAKEPETFPNYQPYLGTHVWPSTNRSGIVERVVVEDMAPQYAAAALAKLVRWALNASQGTLGLLEAGAREEQVRTSPLGRALAARAQNLQPGEEIVLTDVVPAERNDVAAVILTCLWDLLPDAERGKTMAAAVTAAEELGKRYAITRPA